MSDIVIDYTNAFSTYLGENGISSDELTGLDDKIKKAHEYLVKKREAGELPFYDLPYQNLTDILKLRPEFPDADLENVVLLGIGGSALGARALAKALLPPYHEIGNAKYRNNSPRLFVADNIDPDYFSGLMKVLDLAKTFFIVISKSGGTAETMSQFLIVRDLLVSKFGESGYRQRMMAITDKEKGYLRQIVERDKLSVMAVPDGVGGRFSVFTPVGLLPTSICGVDVVGLLGGAAKMDKRTREPDLEKNPAYLLAVLFYLADVKLKKNILVMMPYASGLLETAEWFQQLWAESLGKAVHLDGSPAFSGSTPTRSLGATDQHSQLQLFMEGPADKFTVFFRVKDFKERCMIPPGFEDIEGVGYLSGHSLAELIKAEQKATEMALAKAGRPNLRIELKSLDADALGQIMYMFEVATVFAGGLYEVDPLDQPGVEMGKKYAFSMMGRSGFEKEREEVAKWEKGRQRKRI
jgi:glucose-6-phosphate isomerase